MISSTFIQTVCRETADLIKNLSKRINKSTNRIIEIIRKMIEQFKEVTVFDQINESIVEKVCSFDM